MANIKISQLPSILPDDITNTDVIPIVDIEKSSTRKITLFDLLDFLKNNIDDSEGLVPLNITNNTILSKDNRAVFATNTSNPVITVTLPAIEDAMRAPYHISKADQIPGQVIISANIGETINGEQTFSLNSEYQSIILIHNGINWFIF